MRIVFTLLISLFLTGPCFADWQSTLEGTFDIVETFDNIPDWHGTAAYNPSGDTDWSTDPTDFPDQSAGSGRINYYSYWGASAATQDWIKNHGTSSVWQGTGKSMCLNEANEETGASRLGFYVGTLGSETPQSTGYWDMYLFFMVKIPKNIFPTSITSASPTPIGEYVEGQDLVWTFMKLCAVNMGCPNTGKCADDGYPAANYSDFMVYPHLTTASSEYQVRIQNHTALMDGGGGTLLAANSSSVSNTLHENIVAGEWVGVELRTRNVLINNDTDFETHIDMWFYDDEGTATQVVNDLTWANVLGSEEQPPEPWNNIMIGGNNSNLFTWGTGMDADFYIDDVIVNDSRIGPTYFTLLSERESDTTPPTVTISTSDPQGVSTSSVSIEWTDSDDIGVTSRKWRIGSTPDATHGTECTSPATVTGLSVGSNTVYIGAGDAAGNWGSDSITVNYSPVATTISIINSGIRGGGGVR